MIGETFNYLNDFHVLVQAIYYNYNGDLAEALEQYLQCANWQKAHTIFVTSVAHKLFLQGKSFVCILLGKRKLNVCRIYYATYL